MGVSKTSFFELSDFSPKSPLRLCLSGSAGFLNGGQDRIRTCEGTLKSAHRLRKIPSLPSSFFPSLNRKDAGPFFSVPLIAHWLIDEADRKY